MNLNEKNTLSKSFTNTNAEPELGGGGNGTFVQGLAFKIYIESFNNLYLLVIT